MSPDLITEKLVQGEQALDHMIDRAMQQITAQCDEIIRQHYERLERWKMEKLTELEAQLRRAANLLS